MKTWLKIAGATIACIALRSLSFAVSFLFIGAAWSDTLNFLAPSEIAEYKSPDRQYTLVFYQLGSPDWPFGETDVRFKLKDARGRKLNSVDTTIQDDGSSATEYNVKRVVWLEDRVEVTLQASEMNDKKVKIEY